MQTRTANRHTGHKRQVECGSFTMQIWFGISEYAKTGKYLEGRMRSHPLVVRLGSGDAPQMRDLWDVRMYELDDGFANVQHEFGADLFKAADWRLAHIPDVHLPCTLLLHFTMKSSRHINSLCIMSFTQEVCGKCRFPAVLFRP